MLPNASAVNANPRKISCKLEIGSNTITNVKMLTYSSDWSGNVTVGQVVSSYISATLPTPSFSLAGVNVTLSMGIGNPVNWVQIGIFRVDEESIQTKQGYTSFNAYDKLYYSVNTYHSTGDKSLQTICNEVCSAIGITSATLSASITIDSSILDGYTLRDVLSFIAGYQGENAYLSPSGALDLRWFTSSSYTADGTRANIPYIGENDCTIGRWICQTQDGVITSGSGEGIYFTCPFMTQTRLNALQSQSLTYRKADVDIPYGNFCLQSGDIITVSTTGSNLTVPIMSNSWTYDGGVASSVSSYGVSDYTGTANNAERSLSVRRVQRQMAVYRAASDLKIASEKITGASGGYIRINFGGDGKTAALLIMDTEDISTAQNVWVFNQNGLGHFPNGYDPTAQANVALTYDGWVVAERISGTLISGVGIENVDNALTTKPKIALANGCIHFTETYDYSGSSPQVTDIGKLEYLPRSGQNAPATLALTVLSGNKVSIGEYGYPKFVYNSTPDSSQGEEMFMFNGGNVRVLGNVLFGTSSNPDGLGGMDLEATIADIYSQINGGDVPAVTSSDNGKVLTASYSGGVGTYSWETSGGGGGTTNYLDLSNKPQINSVTLSGNKSLADIGLESKTAASGGTAVSLCTTGEKYTWNNKATLTSSTTPSADSGSGSVGSSSYAARADHVHPLTPIKGSVTWASGYTPTWENVSIRQYGNTVVGQIYAKFSVNIPTTTDVVIGTLTNVGKPRLLYRGRAYTAAQVYSVPAGDVYVAISASTGSIIAQADSNTNKTIIFNFTYNTADP